MRDYAVLADRTKNGKIVIELGKFKYRRDYAVLADITRNGIIVLESRKFK